MAKAYFKIFLFALVAMLVVPFFAYAALQLETIYPASPSTQQLITGRSKLPDIIRYVIDWSVILAALASVFSLIYAGIQYLTSVGRPNAMTAAKSRVWQCLLGLLIIAGAYLLLQTINPQLTLMTIKKAQVGAGIVMFTQAGLYGNGDIDGCYKEITISGECSSDETISTGITSCYNPDAVNGFNTSKSETLENLIKAGAARFLSYDIEDLTTEFGDMVYETDAKEIVTFTDFPVYALGFWGTENTEGGAFVHSAKIFAHPKTQFNVEPPPSTTADRIIEYRIEGVADKDGNVPDVPGPLPDGGRPSCVANTDGSGAKDFGMKLITIHDDFMLHFKSSVTHYNGDTTIYNYDPLHPPSNIISDIAHPPLSIRIEGRGPGVTLYAAIGGARTFSASEEDFSYSNVKFDNAADEIELNNLDNDGGKIHDYLAILHNDYNYTGDLRIFFERREDDNPTDPPPALFLPKIYLDGFSEPNMQEYETNIAFVPGDRSLYCGDSSVDNDPLLNPPNCEAGDPFDSLNPTHFLSFYYFYNNETVDAMSVSAMPTLKQQKGEPPPIYSARAPINKQDRLGRLKDGNKTSSIEIFELENQIVYRDNQGQTSFSSIKKNVACEEVTLCTGKMYLNNCIVFVPNHQDYLADKFNSPSRYDSVILPMPLYVPVNIPKTIKNGLVKIKDEDTGESKMERKNIDFADKIKSLEIKGDCAVVLFENSVKDIADCAQCQFDQKNNPTDDAVCKKCWDNGPGANSEVFTESVGDLTTHSISKCGGREKFGFGERKNCASAIAIFPLKKTD